MRKIISMFVGAFALPWLLVSPARALDADSTGADANRSIPWARWQGRLSLATTSNPWRLGADPSAPRLSSASLLGDYYFSRSLVVPGQLGGLRATSGLLYGSRSTPLTLQPAAASGQTFSAASRSSGPAVMPYGGDALNDASTLPYLGLGYTGLSVRNGWSLNADLGLIAQGGGSTLRLGRSSPGGNQNLDDAVRQMRMTPLLQLGVSYAF